MDFPTRKRNRLAEYDYSHAGSYFVTICTSPRKNVFWQVEEHARLQLALPLNPVVGADIIRPVSDIIRPEDVPLSSVGKIVETGILSISQHYDDVEVEHYCIMPDHIHLLILFHGDIFGKTVCPPLSTVIGSLKRWVSKQLGYSIWQKSFYEHIIRSERDYNKILMYIEHNPLQWQIDHGNDSAWDC